MAKKVIPIINIELDRPRKLKYTNWSVAALQDELKITTEELFLILVNPNLATQRQYLYLVWAGLIWEDESLTVRQVSELLDQEDNTELAKLVFEALGLSVQEPEKDEKESPKLEAPTSI